MKATITTNNHDGNVAKNRKEDHFYQELAVMTIDKPAYEGGSKIRCIIRLRFYGTRAMNYACIWVHGHKKDIYVSGGGKAGGYGYHRASAAAGCAFRDAGIKLDQRIDGVGDVAIEEALEAIAKALGHNKVYIHSAHA